MAQLISITEAARMIGLSRPRMSKIVKAYELEKIKEGGTFLVRKDQVLTLMDSLREEGKLRKPILINGMDEVDVTEPHTQPDTTYVIEELCERVRELERLIPRPDPTQPLRLADIIRDAIKPWK